VSATGFGTSTEPGGDKALGFLLLIISIVVFIYYTCWVMVTPFVEPGHFFHSFFPDRYFAVVIPVVLLIFALTMLGVFLGLVMIRTRQKAKTKAKTA